VYSIENVLFYVTELDSKGHFMLVLIRASSLLPRIDIVSATDTTIQYDGFDITHLSEVILSNLHNGNKALRVLISSKGGV